MYSPLALLCLLLCLCLTTGVAARKEEGPKFGYSKQCLNKDAEVLILGAGMAGISAAKTLSDQQITDFIILEGEERIGGRVKNVVLKSGVRVELGANWIQGIDPQEPEKHPLWDITEQCGGVDGNYAPSIINYTYHLFDEDGANITNSTAFKERFAQFSKIINPLLDEYSMERQKNNLSDVSVREALKLNGWIPTSPADNLMEWYGFDLDEYAVGPENVSLYENFPDDTYYDFGDSERTMNYFVTDQKEGFVKVIRCLSEDFIASERDPRFHLGTTVTKVNWGMEDCVCVSALVNGTVKEYCASYAIVTFSLGVLKSEAVKFIPDLPATKKSVIERGEFYLYLKIFLEFEEIFWNQELCVDNFIRMDPIRGRYSQFQPLTKSIPILFVTVTDNMAEMVYNQSEKETTSQIMEILRGIYGKSIPDPISLTIPDFGVNPLFHGMYSNPPFGYTDEDYNTFVRPEGGLYFGGEATNLKYAGYVHGAYYSGIDTANAIIKRKTLNKQPNEI